MSSATVIVVIGQAWLLAGLCVGVAFLLFGLDRRDAAARGAYGFRPLLLPGMVLLWPLVLRRWLSPVPGAGQSPPGRHHRRGHAAIWTGLAIALPVILTTAWMLRQHDLPTPSSVRVGPDAPGADE